MDTRDALTLTLVNDHNLFIVILMEPIGILVFFNHMMNLCIQFHISLKIGPVGILLFFNLMNLCIQFHILLNSHKKKQSYFVKLGSLKIYSSKLT